MNPCNYRPNVGNLPRGEKNDHLHDSFFEWGRVRHIFSSGVGCISSNPIYFIYCTIGVVMFDVAGITEYFNLVLGLLDSLGILEPMKIFVLVMVIMGMAFFVLDRLNK
jgi:hypothetical protein